MQMPMLFPGDILVRTFSPDNINFIKNRTENKRQRRKLRNSSALQIDTLVGITIYTTYSIDIKLLRRGLYGSLSQNVV